MTTITKTFQASNTIVDSSSFIQGGSKNVYGDLSSSTLQLAYQASDEGGSSLEAFLSFDSDTPSDHSGNNNDGTKNGSLTTEVTGTLSRDCYEYDGNDDYVNISGGLGLTGDFTVSALVNSDDISGPPQTIFSQANYQLKEYDDEYIAEIIGDDSQSWTKSGDVGTGPQGLAVYDGKLYAGMSDSDDIYVFDGSSWTKSGDVGSGPQGLAVYDGKLYAGMFGSNDIYVFDGSSWTKSGNVGTKPIGLAVYDGKLYAGMNGSDDIYVFDGSSWTKSGDVGTGPQGLAVYDGKLYAAMIDSDDIYVFDGSSWTKSGNVGTQPIGLAVYDGKLYAGMNGSDDIYVFDGSSWTKSGDVGPEPRGLAVYDGKLYASMKGPGDIYVFGEGVSLRTDKGSGFEHVGIKKDGDTFHILKNGSSQSSETQAINFTDSAEDFRIGKGWGSSQSGRFGGNNENLNGKIDELRAYNRSLSSAEISSLDPTNFSENARFTDQTFSNTIDVSTMQLENGTLNVPANTTLKAKVHRTDGSNNIQESSDELDLSGTFPIDVTGLSTSGTDFSIEITEMSTTDITKSPTFDSVDLTGDTVNSITGSHQAQNSTINGTILIPISLSGATQAQNSSITGSASALVSLSGSTQTQNATHSGNVLAIVALSGSHQAQDEGSTGDIIVGNLKTIKDMIADADVEFSNVFLVDADTKIKAD